MDFTSDDRKLIKENAKEKIKGRKAKYWGNMILLSLIPLLIKIVLSIIASLLSLVNGTIGTVIGVLASVCSIILSLSVIMVTFEISLALWRETDFSWKKMFDAIASMFKSNDNNVYHNLVITIIMTYLKIFLWSLLLIVPGIYKSFKYSQAVYIQFDNPTWNYKQCIKESDRIMTGHVWNYFVFVLSFIGWILLSQITFGIALIYVLPYISCATVGFYDWLIDFEKDNKNYKTIVRDNTITEPSSYTNPEDNISYEGPEEENMVSHENSTILEEKELFNYFE